ncbi:glycoside hydrolase family 2 TIM barrel-domain containing protein [uncultured Draconibacterium sp.]|uniref:glycoside hydrolase family 2 protein n=1 Tax=uncultured Draconibacterium sp. TaxID=1573823 RepID=UPI0032614E09
MKNLLILFSILVLLVGSVQAQPDFITNVGNRTHVSLGGKWKYIIDQYNTGSIGFSPIYENKKPKDKSDRVEYSFDDAQSLWVPGSWNAQKDELYYYEGSIWYRKTFDFKPKLNNLRVFVYVGAANYKTDYSFNGKKLGTHKGGFTPFSFEVTDLIRENDNFIILGVNNRREVDNIPGLVTDWYNYGGITRDIMLVEVPQTYINDFTIALAKNTVKEKEKEIIGSFSLSGENLPDGAVVEIPELGISQSVEVNESGKGTFILETKQLELWSPENPKLYEVLLKAGEDEWRDRIGFRTIETNGTQVLLNGEPVFLRGISIHDENPTRADRANSMDDARLVLGWAKELGCNFARLAHYPHQENIVRLADEMGILLWEELPLYWGIDWKNEKVLEDAKRQYAEVIRRDKNRAATIIWSIANETVPNEARNNFLKSVASHVRSLDSTRLLSAACKKDSWHDGDKSKVYLVSDPIAEVLDIVSFNEYLGWYGGDPIECREKNFKIAYEKPVIISEFGGGAIQGFHADKATRWSEEFQEYMYKENIAMFERVPGLAGMTPWILADFQSPLRQLPSVQDGWNRKGLVSEKGKKKKAFFVLQEFYRKKQIRLKQFSQ